MSHISFQQQRRPDSRSDGRTASPTVSVISGRSPSTRLADPNYSINASPLSLHAASPASPRSFLYPVTAHAASNFQPPARQQVDIPSASNAPSELRQTPSQSSRTGRNAPFSSLAPLHETHHRDSADFFGARTNASAGQSPNHAQPRPLYRQASLGRQASPLFRTIQRNDSQTGHGARPQRPFPTQQDTTPTSTTNSVLSGTLSSRPSRVSLQIPPPVAHSDMRMPFGDSPTSSFTNDESNLVWSSSESDAGRRIGYASPERLRQPDQFEPHRLPPLDEHSVSSPSLSSIVDESDDHPINSRIPLDKRPPRLDMQAVRDAETRGSLTSLPDLIRRATKLASNLDRGKTASRLGLDAMLGAGNSSNSRRESTYSDVLFAFPAPGSTLSPRRGQTPISMRPSHGTAARATPVVYEDEKPKGPRRCCGMSMTVFLIVLVVLTVLIAAAVLLPIFLILVPAQNPKPGDLRRCAQLHPCNNGGVSVVDDNACSCVCRSGFTGSDCSVAADPSCVFTNIRDGTSSYEGATLGSDVANLPQLAQAQFNISLNATVLLSLFSRHNFSCSGENSLVRFTTPRRLTKRLFILPAQDRQPADLLKTSPASPKTELPKEPASNVAQQLASIARPHDLTEHPSLTAAVTVAKRASTSTATQPSTTNYTVTDLQLNFARIAVLYVLQVTRIPSTAVNSQLLIQQYLRSDNLSNNRTTIDIVPDAGNTITADFGSFTIHKASGDMVGGGRRRV